MILENYFCEMMTQIEPPVIQKGNEKSSEETHQCSQKVQSFPCYARSKVHRMIRSYISKHNGVKYFLK